jgi:hypothetical protein
MIGLVFKGQWISFVADVKLQKKVTMGKLIRPATAFARPTKVLPDERRFGVMKNSCILLLAKRSGSSGAGRRFLYNLLQNSILWQNTTVKTFLSRKIH